MGRDEEGEVRGSGRVATKGCVAVARARRGSTALRGILVCSSKLYSAWWMCHPLCIPLQPLIFDCVPSTQTRITTVSLSLSLSFSLFLSLPSRDRLLFHRVPPPPPHRSHPSVGFPFLAYHELLINCFN